MDGTWTKSELLAVLRECMTESQRKFFETYITLGYSVKKTCEALGITGPSGYNLKDTPPVKWALSVYRDDALREVRETPSLEWTMNELKGLYDKAKGDGQEDKQAKLLKQIMEFQDKFGEMISEEAMKIAQMGYDDLKDYYTKLTAEIEQVINKDKWYA